MTPALWIWLVTLVVITFVVVPLALYLLHRTLRAARSIERYAREALAAGGGIAVHTEAVARLDETIAAATSLLEAAGELEKRTAEIGTTVKGARDR